MTKLWRAVTGDERRVCLAVVIAINLGLMLYTGQSTLRDFPNSGDEYAQYISALIFSEGKLSVPSPVPKDWFTFVHTINDGKFYSKYAPGWPLFLAAGIAAHVPWLMNPIFGSLTLLALYRIARRHYSVRAANLAVLCTLGNPFLIFNSASYFTHPSCLFFLCLPSGPA